MFTHHNKIPRCCHPELKRRIPQGMWRSPSARYFVSLSMTRDVRVNCYVISKNSASERDAKFICNLFSAKVGRYFAPLLGFPLDDGDGDTVCLEPCLGTFDELEELLGLLGALKLGLAAFLAYPADGSAAITIDGHLESLLVEHRQGVHDSEKLTDVVGAVHGAKVEDLLAIAKVYAAVLHRARVAAAGGVYGKGVALHYGRQSVECEGGRIGLLLHIGMGW